MNDLATELQLFQRDLLPRLTGGTVLPDALSTTEARILAALGTEEGVTARQLARQLRLDPGYLSRLLGALCTRGLVRRSASRRDRRAHLLHLTASGTRLAETVAHHQVAAATACVAALPPAAHTACASALAQLRQALDPAPAPVIFRQLRLGDAGWIIHRHGTLIAAEHGWDMRFEALAAEILAQFIRQYDPTCERSWVVERNGVILGSLFLVRLDAQTAKLRLLYVEPAARGLGLATRLLEKSMRFAREKGYQRLTLFTTAENISARRIYEKLGFTRVSTSPNDLFGENLVGEEWLIVL